nr:substrate-binding domain-containing protein [Bacilli bacterium]
MENNEQNKVAEPVTEVSNTVNTEVATETNSVETPVVEPVEQTQDVEPQPVVIPKGEKPKKSGVFAYIIILLLMVLSCAALYYYLIILPKKNNTITDEFLYTKETLPRVDASLATQPLMDAFVLDFTGKTTKEMEIEYSNTDPAYTKLINNETDLIVVTEPSADELKRAEDANVELEVTKVVNEGFVFFVNKNNKVDSLTLEEIRKIYSGEITNWKEVGGDDTEIIAYQRPENSGSQTGLYSLVMKELPVKARTPKEQVTLSMAGIIEYVSDYKNGLDAIGYSYYYYANEMYYSADLKYLGINGIKSTYDTIKDETYPILTAYYIVTRKGETNENVLKLKNDMLSKRGQAVATKAGYVPCK